MHVMSGKRARIGRDICSIRLISHQTTVRPRADRRVGRMRSINDISVQPGVRLYRSYIELSDGRAEAIGILNCAAGVRLSAMMDSRVTELYLQSNSSFCVCVTRTAKCLNGAA